MGLLDLLQDALGGNNPSAKFDQVAQTASTEQLGQGLAAAMRSDQTPPFSSMVGDLFGKSSPAQQAGLLNQILSTVGPAALSAVAGGALGRILSPGQTQVTPEQAAQVSPEQAQEIAAHAEQHQPAVVDQVSAFYAQHAGLIKTLGGAAVALTLAKMKENEGATRG